MSDKVTRLQGAKVTEEMEIEFEAALKKNGTDKSHEIRQFIIKYIAMNKSRRITMQ